MSQPGTEIVAQNQVPANEMQAIGKLAAHNTVDSGDMVEFTPTSGAEIIEAVQGVRLGATRNADGWGSKYKDSSTTPVPSAGIGFKVSQSSAGYTGIEAVAMSGYTVEALGTGNDGNTSWKTKEEWREGVVVSNDGGKGPASILGELWSTATIANPGVQSGIIRVTDPNGSTKHFAMGAEFVGKEDDWTVRGAMMEVTPQMPAEVDQAQRPALPPAQEQ